MIINPFTQDFNFQNAKMGTMDAGIILTFTFQAVQMK
jgi:hypothetical protein